MKNLGWAYGACLIALVIDAGCSDDNTGGGATTTSDTTTGGSGATGGGGSTAGTGGGGSAACPNFPTDSTCGADHEPGENCGACDAEGLFCDFSDDDCSGLHLTCTCTQGFWICDSGDGSCASGGGGSGGSAGGSGGAGGG